jgi:hypothetical protein
MDDEFFFHNIRGIFAAARGKAERKTSFKVAITGAEAGRR